MAATSHTGHRRVVRTGSGVALSPPTNVTPMGVSPQCGVRDLTVPRQARYRLRGSHRFEQLCQLALGISAAQFVTTVRWADDPGH